MYSQSKILGYTEQVPNKVKNGDFVFYKFLHPHELLKNLVNNGYILHGTSREIEGKLVPHQAYDEAKKFGNQKAIYLTSDPLTAIFTALTGGVEEIDARRNSIKSKRGKDGNYEYMETYFAVSNPSKVREKGYIYIFNKDVAEENESNEFISKKPIKPIMIIQVERKDFPYEIEKID